MKIDFFNFYITDVCSRSCYRRLQSILLIKNGQFRFCPFYPFCRF
eukprot:UN15136